MISGMEHMNNRCKLLLLLAINNYSQQHLFRMCNVVFISRIVDIQPCQPCMVQPGPGARFPQENRSCYRDQATSLIVSLRQDLASYMMP